MIGVYIIGGIMFIISLAISKRLKNKFKKYSKIGLRSDLSGKEIAEKMLVDHGIFDVKVLSVQGRLTDHYNPVNKTVNLSPEVYQGRNAAAAAVASHECGHAVQHASAYSFLQLRTALVPIQNISGKIMNIIVMVSIFGGAFLFEAFPYDNILLLIIACYTIMTLFTFVTLPVEFDASRRALTWIDRQGIVTSQEHAMAKDALWWAAMFNGNQDQLKAYLRKVGIKVWRRESR
ncbi:MAG: zinc metallopeptidase [Bacteroidetes bacterium]|nr:zinc metallopeptidase [Bacteroidota bacterium]